MYIYIYMHIYIHTYIKPPNAEQVDLQFTVFSCSRI